MEILTQCYRYLSSLKADGPETIRKLEATFQQMQDMTEPVTNIVKQVTIIFNPGRFKHDEVVQSLDELDAVRNTNPFVKALQNLPPTDALFEKARALRVSGSKVKTLCLRFNEFKAKQETVYVFESLAVGDFDHDLCPDINTVVDEFIRQFEDIPETTLEFQGACES